MSSSCFTWQFALGPLQLTSASHHLPVKESLWDEAEAQKERREENIIAMRSLGVSGVSHRFPAEMRRTTDGSPQEEEAWGWMCMYAFVHTHLLLLKRRKSLLSRLCNGAMTLTPHVRYNVSHICQTNQANLTHPSWKESIQNVSKGRPFYKT